jgi:hypothetical protein
MSMGMVKMAPINISVVLRVGATGNFSPGFMVPCLRKRRWEWKALLVTVTAYLYACQIPYRGGMEFIKVGTLYVTEALPYAIFKIL